VVGYGLLIDPKLISSIKTKFTNMTENEQLIDLISKQTADLLRSHWPDIDSYRNGDDEIKLAFAHTLSYEGDERTVKTSISFSHRIKDSVEESINTAQADLPLKVTIEKGRRQ
jgi:hypothetical protein